MTATYELRRLLDERGVKYQKINEHVTWVFLEDRVITFFSDELGVSAEVSYPKPVLNGTKFITPEQAIAATLGGGTLTVEQVEEAVYRNCKFYEGGEVDVEAIADELNSRAKPPCEGGYCPLCGAIERTCKIESSYYYDDYDLYEFEFSCGHSVNMYDKEPTNYCPICGCKVVS